MFIRLGFQNAWRNLQRSILAILAMALAASFFTFTVSLSKGYAQHAGQPLSSMLGGEILVQAMKTTADFSSQQEEWEFEQGAVSPFASLNYLQPQLAQTGFLKPSQALREFDLTDLEKLAEQPFVVAAKPLYRLPAEMAQQVDLDALKTPLPPHLLVQGEDGSTQGPDVLTAIGLQAKACQEEDRYSLESSIVQGRWFSPEDQGKYVAVISENMNLQGLAKTPAVGQKVRIKLPKINDLGHKWNVDFTDAEEIEVEIIGHLSVVSRTVDYEVGIDGWVTEEIYAYFNEFYLPQETWLEIWQSLSPYADFKPAEVLLEVKDLSYLQDIVYDLQREFPQFSFHGLPEYQKQIHDNLSLEPKIPAGARAMLQERSSLVQQTVIQADLRKPITLLVMINAGLLVAANILILVSERKDEIAILKAIGAREKEIILMILAEAALITALGASFGFLFIRIQAVLNQLTNPMGLFYLLLLFFRDFLTVLTVSLAAALLFGWMPARKYAKLPVMEVLRLD